MTSNAKHFLLRLSAISLQSPITCPACPLNPDPEPSLKVLSVRSLPGSTPPRLTSCWGLSPRSPLPPGAFSRELRERATGIRIRRRGDVGRAREVAGHWRREGEGGGKGEGGNRLADRQRGLQGGHRAPRSRAPGLRLLEPRCARAAPSPAGRAARGPLLPSLRAPGLRAGGWGAGERPESLAHSSRQGPNRRGNAANADSDLGNRNPPGGPAAASLRMGGYLGRPGSPPSSPARARAHATEQVQRVHRAHPAPRHRPPRRPPGRDPTGRVDEAWRRFPMKRPRNAIVGPLPSDWWDSYFRRSVWSLRHPRARWSPVIVRIAPPKPWPARAIRSAGPPASEKPPDPCAKETVLRALRGCTKGRAGWKDPPRPGGLQAARRSPDLRPSAFRPLLRNGVLASFEPRPGPLRRSPDSLGPDRSASGGPGCPSRSPEARAHSGGPPRSPRNAISSSYSSSRPLGAPGKRRAPGAALQPPEWPVRKKGKGRRSPSPGPPPPARSPACSGGSEPQGQGPPRPRRSPGTPGPPPGLRDADPDEDQASRHEVGLRWSSTAREDGTEVPTRCVPEPGSAARPAASPGPPGAGTARTQDADPRSGSFAETREPPAASPPSPGRAVPAALSPLKEVSPLPSRGCSQPEPLPRPSSDSESAATWLRLTPASAPPPASDATRPPPAAQAGGTAAPPERPALTPAPPAGQRVAFLGGRAPLPPASAPPAAASAHPTPHPTLGLPPNGEIGDSLRPSISATASAPSAPGLLAPTFRPVFGRGGPRQTGPGVAPSSSEHTSPPAPPAPPHLLRSLLKATAVVVSATPARACQDSPFPPPVDIGAVSLSGAVDQADRAPACRAFLLGASCAFRACFSQATSFIFPPHPRAPVPAVHTVTIFSQVLSGAVQMPPRKSSADLRGPPLPVSAPAAGSRSALTARASGVGSALAAPSGAGSRPPFPPSQGAPLQPALGAPDGQEQGAPAAPPGPSVTSPFGPGTWATAAPAPTPAGPAFGKTARSASGGLTPSASTCRVPSAPSSGVPPNLGSAPAGSPFGQTGAAGFGAAAQTRRGGAAGSVFGSTAPRPFAFGGLVTPMDCGESGVSVTAPDRSSDSGAFSTAALRSGTTGAALTPFGKGRSQNTRGLASQSKPLVLGRTNTSARKTMFGGPGMAPFAQSTPVPGPLTRSSGLGFGMASPPARSSVGRGPFRPSASSFSIGAKSKTPKSREQAHSRRHHAHKK
ncbi:POM121-like protein 2 [Felis catus]|uniref:POM121-like protein 2 n=1 Tax=Felis catus TaxID=9685 RepID=UPI001D19E102|nr:POM121-like protein 2 [Felis catus]